tara:strand:- start:112 stop:438 length:327 start_codon:yes stop_codon:yes gene_type:complete
MKYGIRQPEFEARPQAIDKPSPLTLRRFAKVGQKPYVPSPLAGEFFGRPCDQVEFQCRGDSQRRLCNRCKNTPSANRHKFARKFCRWLLIRYSKNNTRRKLRAPATRF